jgi:hypothetical protein
MSNYIIAPQLFKSTRKKKFQKKKKVFAFYFVKKKQKPKTKKKTKNKIENTQIEFSQRCRGPKMNYPTYGLKIPISMPSIALIWKIIYNQPKSLFFVFASFFLPNPNFYFVEISSLISILCN